MAREWENNCVSCPQGCIHCGREKDYEVVYCDACGISEEDMYNFEDEDLCERHLFEAWENWGNASFDINKIEDDDMTQDEKQEYLDDLLSDIAGNYLELIDLLDDWSYPAWEIFKRETRIEDCGNIEYVAIMIQFRR